MEVKLEPTSAGGGKFDPLAEVPLVNDLVVDLSSFGDVWVDKPVSTEVIDDGDKFDPLAEVPLVNDVVIDLSSFGDLVFDEVVEKDVFDPLAEIYDVTINDLVIDFSSFGDTVIDEVVEDTFDPLAEVPLLNDLVITDIPNLDSINSLEDLENSEYTQNCVSSNLLVKVDLLSGIGDNDNELLDEVKDNIIVNHTNLVNNQNQGVIDIIDDIIEDARGDGNTYIIDDKGNDSNGLVTADYFNNFDMSDIDMSDLDIDISIDSLIEEYGEEEARLMLAPVIAETSPQDITNLKERLTKVQKTILSSQKITTSTAKINSLITLYQELNKGIIPDQNYNKRTGKGNFLTNIVHKFYNLNNSLPEVTAKEFALKMFEYIVKLVGDTEIRLPNSENIYNPNDIDTKKDIINLFHHLVSIWRSNTEVNLHTNNNQLTASIDKNLALVDNLAKTNSKSNNALVKGQKHDKTNNEPVNKTFIFDGPLVIDGGEFSCTTCGSDISYDIYSFCSSLITSNPVEYIVICPKLLPCSKCSTSYLLSADILNHIISCVDHIIPKQENTEWIKKYSSLSNNENFVFEYQIPLPTFVNIFKKVTNSKILTSSKVTINQYDEDIYINSDIVNTEINYINSIREYKNKIKLLKNSRTINSLMQKEKSHLSEPKQDFSKNSEDTEVNNIQVVSKLLCLCANANYEQLKEYAIYTLLLFLEDTHITYTSPYKHFVFDYVDSIKGENINFSKSKEDYEKLKNFLVTNKLVLSTLPIAMIKQSSYKLDYMLCDPVLSDILTSVVDGMIIYYNIEYLVHLSGDGKDPSSQENTKFKFRTFLDSYKPDKGILPNYSMINKRLSKIGLEPYEDSMLVSMKTWVHNWNVKNYNLASVSLVFKNNDIYQLLVLIKNYPEIYSSLEEVLYSNSELSKDLLNSLDMHNPISRLKFYYGDLFSDEELSSVEVAVTLPYKPDKLEGESVIEYFSRITNYKNYSGYAGTVPYSLVIESNRWFLEKAILDYIIANTSNICYGSILNLVYYLADNLSLTKLLNVLGFTRSATSLVDLNYKPLVSAKSLNSFQAEYILVYHDYEDSCVTDALAHLGGEATDAYEGTGEDRLSLMDYEDIVKTIVECSNEDTDFKLEFENLNTELKNILIQYDSISQYLV